MIALPELSANTYVLVILSDSPKGIDSVPDDEIETVPIDPSICDSDTNTIVWQEQTKHTVSTTDGKSHTCYHTYTYKAKLKVDSIKLSPDPIKSNFMSFRLFFCSA